MSRPSIENVVISNQGQLAFINADTLYVETQPRSGVFLELGNFALAAAWSPKGERVVYSLAGSADQSDSDAVVSQYIWSATDQNAAPITDLVPGYPIPNYYVIEAYWSPDGDIVLFQALLDERHSDKIFPFNAFLLITVSLAEGYVDELLFLASQQQVAWLTENAYIVRGHCGSPCADFEAYSYSGELLWQLPWATGGMVDFAMRGEFMVSAGRLTTDGVEDATVDEIDISTGTISEYWHKPVITPDYFTAYYNPHISPDEQFVSFNYGGELWPNPGTLFIIDRSGKEHRQYENSYVIDWYRDNRIAVAQNLDSGEVELLSLSLNSPGKDIIATLPNSNVTGKWSPDGQYLVFATETYSGSDGKLYIWHSDFQQLQLIDSTPNARFQIVSWLPNSKSFYFTAGQSSVKFDNIWLYEIHVDELTLVATGQ